MCNWQDGRTRPDGNLVRGLLAFVHMQRGSQASLLNRQPALAYALAVHAAPAALAPDPQDRRAVFGSGMVCGDFGAVLKAGGKSPANHFKAEYILPVKGDRCGAEKSMVLVRCLGCRHGCCRPGVQGGVGQTERSAGHMQRQTRHKACIGNA